jgi:hypothetical protein
VLIWMALAGVFVALLFGGLLPRYRLSRKLSVAAQQQAADPPAVNVIRSSPRHLGSLSSFRNVSH